MASGRLNLVVRGLQDELVTGSPSMSFFNKKFVKESSYEIFIRDCATETNNKLNYGETLRFKVPRVGDLISKIFLRLILPATFVYTNLRRIHTDKFVLYSLLETVDLYIGGQLIERLTGEYIHNYIKLYFSRNEFNSVVSTSEIDVEAGSQGYIRYDQFCLLPIPFYFYNNPGKEIPLLALSKHDVEVVIKFTPKPAIAGLPDLTAFSMPVEFINIDEETKKQFTNKGIMYKIEQVQMEHGYINPSEKTKTIPLKFINPVRELSVCIQQLNYTDLEGARFIKFFCNYRNVNEAALYSNNEVGYYLQGHHIYGLDLTLNGNKIIDKNSSGHSRYLSAYIPQKYYTNPDNAQFFKQYIYPFALNPIHKNSVGHVNMSRIKDKEMTLYMTPSDVNRTYRIYATSYNIFMIKDGISGLLFTHNNEYKYNVPRGIPTDAPTETNTPPANLPDTGGETFYYAITSDQPITGIQLFSSYNPSFPNSLTLQNTSETQILTGDNSFFYGVDILDENVYAPASKITFFDDIDTNINKTGTQFLTRYHVDLTKESTFVFSSQKSNALFMRVGVLTNTSKPGTTAYNPVTTEDRLGYSNLTTSETIHVFYSTEFFDSSDITGWMSRATRVQKIIRTDNVRESDGYYYLANVDNVDGNFRYNDVLFGRTYDIRIFFNITISESFDNINNISTVTISYTDVPPSRVKDIKVYRDSSKTSLITTHLPTGEFTYGSFQFVEERLQSTYSYFVVYSDGAVNIETTTQSIEAGKNLTFDIEGSRTAIQPTTNDLLVSFDIVNTTEVASTFKVYTSSDHNESNLIGSATVTNLRETVTFSQDVLLANNYSYYGKLTYLYGDSTSNADISYDGNLVSNILQSNVTYMGYRITDGSVTGWAYGGNGGRSFLTKNNRKVRMENTFHQFSPIGTSFINETTITNSPDTPTGFSFSPDGQYFAVCTQDSDDYIYIWECTYTTYWIYSESIVRRSKTRVDTFSPPLERPSGITWQGDNLYVTDADDNHVHQLTVSTDRTTITHTGNRFNLGFNSRGITMSSDGKQLVLGDSANLSLKVYLLTTPFDITTATYAGVITLNNVIPSGDRPSTLLPNALHIDNITFQNLTFNCTNNDRVYYLTFDKEHTEVPNVFVATPYSLQNITGEIDVASGVYNTYTPQTPIPHNFYTTAVGGSYMLGGISSDAKFFLISVSQSSRMIKLTDSYDAANNFSLSLYDNVTYYESSNTGDFSCGGGNSSFSMLTPHGYILTFNYSTNILYENGNFDPTYSTSTYFPTGSLNSLGTINNYEINSSSYTSGIGNIVKTDAYNNTYWFTKEYNNETILKFTLNLDAVTNKPIGVNTTATQESVRLTTISGYDFKHFDFSDDGEHLITLRNNGLYFDQYSLSSAFDLSTISYVRSIETSEIFGINGSIIQSFRIFTQPADNIQYIVATNNSYSNNTAPYPFLISSKLVVKYR